MGELDEYDINEGTYRRVFVLRFWKFKFIVEVRDEVEDVSNDSNGSCEVREHDEEEE